MDLMESLVKEGKTTGPKQNADYAAYTRLNLARMQRLNKTVVIEPGLEETIKSIAAPQKWYVLTEAWCGDAAQCVPVMAGAVALNTHISLTLMLRDENPDVIGRYLTNGGKSIPKLIALDEEGNELFTWGPRPAGAQELYAGFMAEPGRPFAELAEALQRWYHTDKTLSVQKELLAAIKNSL